VGKARPQSNEVWLRRRIERGLGNSDQIGGLGRSERDGGPSFCASASESMSRNGAPTAAAAAQCELGASACAAGRRGRAYGGCLGGRSGPLDGGAGA
jgi:hypothetical protein